MNAKKLGLDDATVAVMRTMLNTPPKPHDEMKLGRPSAKKKKRDPAKGRASSAKRRSA